MDSPPSDTKNADNPGYPMPRDFAGGSNHDAEFEGVTSTLLGPARGTNGDVQLNYGYGRTGPVRAPFFDPATEDEI